MWKSSQPLNRHSAKHWSSFLRKSLINEFNEHNYTSRKPCLQWRTPRNNGCGFFLSLIELCVPKKTFQFDPFFGHTTGNWFLEFLIPHIVPPMDAKNLFRYICTQKPNPGCFFLSKCIFSLVQKREWIKPTDVKNADCPQINFSGNRTRMISFAVSTNRIIEKKGRLRSLLC